VAFIERAKEVLRGKSVRFSSDNISAMAADEHVLTLELSGHLGPDVAAAG
jgi:hypothetical protein